MQINTRTTTNPVFHRKETIFNWIANKYIKKYLNSPVTREIQIKTKRYYFTISRLAEIRKTIIPNVGKNTGGQSRVVTRESCLVLLCEMNWALTLRLCPILGTISEKLLHETIMGPKWMFLLPELFGWWTWRLSKGSDKCRCLGMLCCSQKQWHEGPESYMKRSWKSAEIQQDLQHNPTQVD